MSSIHTNGTALSTLATMRSIVDLLEQTQRRAATGLRVEKASDNAAYWAIGTTMRSDIKSLETVSEALDLSHAIVDTAYTGATTIIDLLTQIRNRIVLAQDADATGRAKLQLEIKALQDSYAGVMQSSSFAGQNWLFRDSKTQGSTATLVTGLSRSTNGSFTLITSKIDLSKVMLADIGPNNPTIGFLTKSYSAKDTAGFTYTRHGYVKNNGNGMIAVDYPASTWPPTVTAALTAFLSMSDQMIQAVTGAAATLGAIRSSIDSQKSFAAQLAAVQKKSLGRLLDADLDETSSRLRALQTREQLAIKGLSIANEKPATILSLFH